MNEILTYKEEFLRKRDELFKKHSRQTDSLKFSKEYSLWIEETIREIASANKYNFALASAGSFSRRELSPYSDIDLMFIAKSVKENEEDISKLVTSLWDHGLEVSHTVRDFSDVQKYILSDLHTLTQFFETRYILGSETIYNEWNENLFASITEDAKIELINQMFDDINARYEKHGDSPKVLEPNVKLSAGGLRDLQAVEWMFILTEKVLLNKQEETTQVESFIKILGERNITSPDECRRLLGSYKLILAIRNLLHLHSKQRTDRFEFSSQIEIADVFGYSEDDLTIFMSMYYKAANIINRFTRSMIKKFKDEISSPIPESLAIVLDDDFQIRGKVISLRDNSDVTLSDILRAFYYRGLYTARFDETFRSEIIDKVEGPESLHWHEVASSAFFREILKLPANVGQTLSAMNELGLLSAFMPEFSDLNGFLQHGVYHCYTADEHTLIAMKNVESLKDKTSNLAKIYNKLQEKEILFLALLFHDIAKPINLSGHEIIGAEMASSIMNRLGYSENEIDNVSFLVKHHLLMEQVAFRRNLNDPETLNNFAAHFNSIEELDLLYLLTYADISAVNPAVWTNWKSDLLEELYRKSRAMLEEKITGEDLLMSTTYVIPTEVSKHSDFIDESHVKDHFDSINDDTYSQNFSVEEIARHVEEISRGISLSVLFKDLNGFTNITVITKDTSALLSKICGVFAINDINIHDAKIFTRKDALVIDTFNVTDFQTSKKITPDRYQKIENDLESVIEGMLQLQKEVAIMKSRWRRLESKLFGRSGNAKITFDNHEKYTIIDVSSPDRLGFLYQVTRKMNELGITIYFAKISTKGDDIVDSFYVLNRNGKKISPNDFGLIQTELSDTISQLM
jgi:[protein-PII] uridylyltransferase